MKIRKRQRAKKYNYNKDRKKAWKKEQTKRRKRKACNAGPLREHWDESKSIEDNFRAFGLSSDPNATLEKGVGKGFKTKGRKRKVISALVEEGNKPLPPSMPVVTASDKQFCHYMLQKYGSDYKAMAKDFKNVFQHTPKFIKKKIESYQKYTFLEKQLTLTAKEPVANVSCNENESANVVTMDTEDD